MTVAGPQQFGLYGRRARVWRIVAASLGLLDFLAGVHVIFSDGISYLEIARNYATGNWHLAINGYWSPLYSWLLALLRIAETTALAMLPSHSAADHERLLRLDNNLEVIGLHVLNLAAYAAAWIAFERLLKLVDKVTAWKSEAGRSAFVFAACYTFLCFALYAVGTDRPCADMIVLALSLWAACIVVLVRSEPFSVPRLALLGALVAVAYLAKTAMLPSGSLLVVCAVILCRGRRVRAALAAAVPLAGLAFPWIWIVSAHEGHWTIGESGRLNYAWEVDGAPRYFHWQGIPPEFGVPKHTTRQLMSDPPVYEFGGPITATYPPWYDPAYWNAGMVAPFHLAAQLNAWLLNARSALFLLVVTPGLFAALLAACKRPRFAARRLLDWWFLLFPAVSTILLYCVVFLDPRYVAGPFLILGTVALSALLADVESKAWADGVRIQTVAFAFVLLSLPALSIFQVLLDPANKAVSAQISMAAEMRGLGLVPGDRIGYVGMGVMTYWPLCEGVRIVAEIPARHRKQDTIIRNVGLVTEDTDEFWLGGPDRQAKAIAAMKSAGARAIVADLIPANADLSRWQELRTHGDPQFKPRDRAAVLFLDR